MVTRSLEKAKQAFKKKSAEASKKAHQFHPPEDHKIKRGQYIKSVIYGGLDGTITTFAIVAGIAGAELSAGIVLILGFANLIADGLSMATGDYLSTKAEKEFAKAERARETWEVNNYPEGEMKEMVEIYTEKGIKESDAKKIVEILSKHKKAWIDVMMCEELGIVETDESPIKNGIVTFFAFAIFGFMPLVAYVLARFIPGIQNQTFITACILTGLTLFTLGALKAKLTGQKWFISGLEMFIVGGLAASAAYIIGYTLSGLA